MQNLIPCFQLPSFPFSQRFMSRSTKKKKKTFMCLYKWMFVELQRLKRLHFFSFWCSYIFLLAIFCWKTEQQNRCFSFYWFFFELKTCMESFFDFFSPWMFWFIASEFLMISLLAAFDWVEKSVWSEIVVIVLTFYISRFY